MPPGSPVAEVRKNRAGHAIRAHCPLTAPHDHQERPGSFRNPCWQGLVVQNSLPNRCSGHLRPASWNPFGCGGQAHGHNIAETPKQLGHAAWNRVGFMQNHRTPTQKGAEDGRSGDVPTCGEHHLDVLLMDQLAHGEPGADQAKQLDELVSPRPCDHLPGR